MNYNFFSVVTVTSIFFSSIIAITILLKSKKTRKFNLPLVLFIFSTDVSIFNIGFLIYTNNYERFPHLISYSTIATYLIGPFFYIYVKQLLFPEEKIRRHLHFIPAVVVFILSIPFQLQQGNEKIMLLHKLLNGQVTFVESIMSGSSSIVGIFSMTLYFAHSYYLMRKKGYLLKKYNPEKKPKLKSWLIFVVYTNLISIAVLFITSYLSIIAGYDLNILFKTVPVIVGPSISLISLRILIQPELFFLDKEEIYQTSRSQDSSGIVEGIMKKRIEKVISENELYRNPELTLPILASEIGMTRADLSRTINTEFNMNFYDFINRFRINAIKEKIMSDPWKLNILDIAFTSGFKSKTTFNVCFKRYEKITPTQFKNRIIEKWDALYKPKD